MTTLTSPSSGKSDAAYRQTEKRISHNGRSMSPTLEIVEARVDQCLASLAVEQQLAAQPAQSQPLTTGGQEGFLSRLGRNLLAFYDWLSGPPATERDRFQSKVADTERVRRAIDVGVFLIG